VLAWVFSRARWGVDVLLEAAIGAFFLLAPWATLELLEARPSPEAATLFRLYGVVMITRALAHRAAFGVPDPAVQRRVLHGDLFFSTASAVVLGGASAAGLTGAAGWGVVAFFALEAVGHASVLAGLRRVSRSDLERALAASWAASGSARGPDAA
jgi:hypothetical protein